MPQKDTSSTAASEDLDALVDFRKLTDEMRKEIREIYSVLNVHAGAIEKLLREKPFSEQWSASRNCSPAPKGSHSRDPSPMASISATKHIHELVGEQIIPFDLTPTENVRNALQDASTTLTRECLDDSAALIAGCSDTVLVAGNIKNLSAPDASGYEMASDQVPVAGVESHKRQGGAQLRAHDGRISRSVPQRGQPGRQPAWLASTTGFAGPRQASPLAHCSHVPGQDAVSTSPLFGLSVRTANVGHASWSPYRPSRRPARSNYQR